MHPISLLLLHTRRIGSCHLPIHLDPRVRSHIPRADMARSIFSTFKGVDAFGKTMDNVKVKTRCVTTFEGVQVTEGG